MELEYLPKATEGHMLPQAQTLEVWKEIQKATSYKHIFEIGLNAGHSAAMNLELFPDVKVTSLDINRHKYTKVAADTLKEKFGDRFDYIFCHSHAYLDRLISGRYTAPDCDIMFVDGGHDAHTLLNDVVIGKFIGITNILIDDTDGGFVAGAAENLERLGIYTKVKDYKYRGWSREEGERESMLTHYIFN